MPRVIVSTRLPSFGFLAVDGDLVAFDPATTALVRTACREVRAVDEPPLGFMALAVTAVTGVGKFAVVKVSAVLLTAPTRTIALWTVVLTPVTMHSVVPVQLIWVSCSPPGTESFVQLEVLDDAGPANIPSPEPSVPMTKHAVGAQVI